MKYKVLPITVLLVIAFVLTGIEMHADSKWPPLMEASYSGNLTAVKRLVTEGADPNIRDDDDSTPLMVAASRGHKDIVEELLATGADINSQNRYGWTPLMLATNAKHAKIVKVLLSNGANAEIEKPNGDTAITIAKSVGLDDLFSPPPESSASKTEELRSPSRSSQPHPADAVKAEADAERKEEQKQRRARIAQLLELGKKHLQASRLTLPRGNNAYESYLEVLEIDPTNDQAKAGLERIADRYARLAERDQGKGSLERSLTFVERGLQVSPGNPSLLALRKQIQTQLTTAKRAKSEDAPDSSMFAEQARQQRQITQHLEQANARIQAAQLDTARVHYQKVLELDRENTDAHTGLKRIAEQYAQRARNHQRQGALREGLADAKAGLQAMPEHTALQALRDTLQTALAEQARQQRQITQHLEQANAQIQAAQLDTARVHYQKVLELDPENTDAHTGLKRIAEQCAQRARNHQRQGALREGLADAKAGLQAMPEHTALQALRDTLQTALAEQAQQQRQITQHLEDANAQIQAAQLDTARAHYQKVLELDPENTDAHTGLKRIAEQYQRLAHIHQKKGELQKSLSYIEKGLEIFPRSHRLLAIDAQLKDQMEAIRRQEAERERKRQEKARHLAEALQTLRAKVKEFAHIEKQLSAEELKMRLSMQRFLEREWHQRPLRRPN